MFLFTDFSRLKVWVLLLHLGAVLILKWTSCKSMANVLPETWGLWQPWSQCSATCGDGVRERRRVCLTSFPSCSCLPGLLLPSYPGLCIGLCSPVWLTCLAPCILSSYRMQVMYDTSFSPSVLASEQMPNTYLLNDSNWNRSSKQWH